MADSSVLKSLRIAIQLTLLLSVVLLANLLVGCGGDSCVIINNEIPKVESSVTFALEGSSAAEDVEGIVVIGDGCDDGCVCHQGCDCSALWAAADGEPACEPLVDASYEESIPETRTLRFHLRADDAVGEGTALLRCAYRGTREPVPADFRVELLAGSDADARAGSGSGARATQPTLAVSEISER